jgi:NAD(P)-dependent dehydrogenase (short-subunit alcohol dehydrogenase family)/acyl carrier protein
MLRGDAALEADLGIDSIKRVEILGAYIASRPQQEQTALRAQMDRLTGARTIDAIQSIIGEVRTAAQPPAAVTAAGQAVRDVNAELLRVVSERTGYPPEILNLDTALETDLGIDSIKRVEFLGAFRRTFSEPESRAIGAVMDELTRARTLREIVTAVEKALGSGHPPSEPVPQLQTGQYRLATQEIANAVAAPSYPGRVNLLTDDETGLAESIARHLTAIGEVAVLLRHDAGPSVSSHTVVTVNLTEIDATLAAVDQIRKVHGRVDRLIHLLPLRLQQNWTEMNDAAWKHSIALDVHSLYAVTKAVQPDLEAAGSRGGAGVVAITGRGGDFGLAGAEALVPLHCAVADFVKTVAMELADVRCSVIDVDPGDPAVVLVAKVLEELRSADRYVQIGRPGDRRLTVVPQVLASAYGGEPLSALTSESTVLLTGGARGITAEIAKSIAERYRCHIVLAGTSPLPASGRDPEMDAASDAATIKTLLVSRLRSGSSQIRPADIEAASSRILKDREILRNISEIKRFAATVEYVRVDVRDSNDFEALLNRMTDGGRSLDVVIHGAGIIEDKLLRDKTPESFSRVVETKAVSGRLLARKLQAGNIGRLIFMSSVTAAFGNRGQADYAAANGTLNGFALALAGAGKPVISYNWGPWDRAGMVSPAVREQFLARGIRLIPIEDGVGMVMGYLGNGSGHAPLVVAGDGPWSGVALREDGTPAPLRAAAGVS